MKKKQQQDTSMLCTSANLFLMPSRLTLSVIWKLSKDGKILDTWFGKTVVK